MVHKWSRTIVAGVAGTLVMTGVGFWVAPRLGMPRLFPPALLAMRLGGSVALGWATHLLIGIVLARVLERIGSRLPGSPPVRGTLFSLAPWFLAMTVVLPIQGLPAFTGTMRGAIGNLIGHLTFGCITGSVLGRVWVET